jgi:hypothetical protein
MNEPVFIQADNYNYFLTLKQWLCEPSVFFVLFVWILATILSVKIYDAKPFKWVLVLTIFLLIFRVFPMRSHPVKLTDEQITQIATAAANAPLPPVVAPSPIPKAVPVATPTVTPKETPSAQMINN